MWAVDFSPNLANVADIEHSDAASAKDAGLKQTAPSTIEKVATVKRLMPLHPFLEAGRSLRSHPTVDGVGAFADPYMAETRLAKRSAVTTATHSSERNISLA
jgi:hypothetical protein